MNKLWSIALVSIVFLLGCAPSANDTLDEQKREIKVFARTLYSAANAVEIFEVDKTRLSYKDLRQEIAREISTKCLLEKPELFIEGRKSDITWKRIPDVVKNGGSCKMEVLNDGEFKSTVMGNSSTNNFTSVNGY